MSRSAHHGGPISSNQKPGLPLDGEGLSESAHAAATSTDLGYRAGHRGDGKLSAPDISGTADRGMFVPESRVGDLEALGRREKCAMVAVGC